MPYEVIIDVEGDIRIKKAKNKDEIIQILGVHIANTTGDAVQVKRK